MNYYEENVSAGLMLIAVDNDDEANIMSCYVAKATAVRQKAMGAYSTWSLCRF